MNQPQPPPQQPESGTQKVGGTTQRPPPESADPALAGSVEKLDQVRDRDSPAELFRMIENNNPRPLPKSNGKDW
jgi:Ca-activated chloride channel family protein